MSQFNKVMTDIQNSAQSRSIRQIERVTIGETNYRPFFTIKDYLSNFYPAPIPYDGYRGLESFRSSEQLFMYLKAQLFNDMARCVQIQAEQCPKAAKALGRKVRPFDEEIWYLNRTTLMTLACTLKFQNINLRKMLLATGDDILVECSPYDAIWGVGMDVNQFSKLDDISAVYLATRKPNTNLLGRVLMHVRGRYNSLDI